MQVDRLTFLVVTSALLGCGGGGSDDGGTTGPPPPPPGTTQTLGSISTNVTSINLVAGNSQTITVTAYDTQGGVISNPGTPTFTSSQANVADVDAAGIVFGVSSGTTVVTVSLVRGSVTKTASVSVTVTGTLPSTASVSTTSGDVFTPGTVAIARGGSVTWTFGTTIHNVTFAGSAGAPNNIPNTSGGTESRTFTQAGNFSYVCTIHSGMNGQVVVR
jgi:plastocyanin